jgi:hypothetical protein
MKRNLIIGLLALAALLRAQSPTGARVYLGVQDFSEEFCGQGANDATSSGNRLFAYPWFNTISTGVFRDVASTANHPCIVRLESNSSTGGRSTLILGTSGRFANMTSSGFPDWTAYFVIMPRQTTNVRYYVGFTDGVSANPSTGGNVDGYFIGFDTERTSPDSTNWRYSLCTNDTCQGAADNSGVAVTADTWYVMRIRKVATGIVDFAISTDGGLTFSTAVDACASGCIITATPTTATLSPNFTLVGDASEANARYLDVDYFWMLFESAPARN